MFTTQYTLNIIKPKLDNTIFRFVDVILGTMTVNITLDISEFGSGTEAIEDKIEYHLYKNGFKRRDERNYYMEIDHKKNVVKVTMRNYSEEEIISIVRKIKIDSLLQ